jgi:hypothetical protein
MDEAAIALQGLRTKARAGAGFLLRVDDTAEAALRPFQFDAAAGLLHRRGCRAIPHGAALYGLAHVTRDDLAHACKRCQPVPDEHPPTDKTERTDLLFGLVSVIDQFAGVIKERGKEFRKTSEGQRLSAQIGTAYRSLDQGQQGLLDLFVATLDQLIERVKNADETLHGKGPEGDK